MKLNRADYLGIVGLILSIPGFLVAFLIPDKVIIGVLTLLLAFVALLLSSLWQREIQRRQQLEIQAEIQAKLPIFSLTDHDIVLRLEDSQGSLARMRSTRNIVTNHKGVNEYWIPHLAVDGRIDEILINDSQPDKAVQRFGELHVCKRYERNLERGDSRTIVLSMVWKDCYKKQKEFFVYSVADVTDHARIRIEFPLDRPCLLSPTSPKAYLMHHGRQFERLADPRLGSQGSPIELEIKNPRLGAEYQIEWEW